MAKILPFDAAMKAAGNCPSLMIANGFSIKYFRYSNLLEKSGLDEDGPLRELFNVLATVDFEIAIRALEDAVLVEKTYNKDKRATALSSEAEKLRGALVHAVRITHPAHREDIAAEIPACIKFLSQFDTIFTLNYDLLLYWVTLDDTKQFRDGFGLAEKRDGFLWHFKTDAHCNVYNLHGGLHLFKTEEDELEKRIDEGSGVIDAIASTVTQTKRLPLYVAEGTSIQKLARIHAVPYLRHCYDKLRTAENAFFVYGHSASTNDAHIYNALFKSNISHLYFCVHKPTADIDAIDGELARYQKRNGSKIEYSLVDAETANVWGQLCAKREIGEASSRTERGASAPSQAAQQVRGHGLSTILPPVSPSPCSDRQSSLKWPPSLAMRSRGATHIRLKESIDESSKQSRDSSAIIAVMKPSSIGPYN